MKTGITDYIILECSKSERIKVIGYLIRDSENGFSGFKDGDDEILMIDHDDTENLILMGIKFRYKKQG